MNYVPWRLQNNLLTIFRAVHAIKRVLGMFPVNPQSVSISPYLDHSLFSYDEKFIGRIER